MERRVVRAIALAAAGLSVVLTGCGSSSDLPSPTQPSAGAQVVKVNVSGPTEVAPGGTAQFKATAQYSDGTLRDVTSEVSWWSSDTSVLLLSNGGVAKGIRNGEARVLAAGEVQGSSPGPVIVVPEGTFKLSVTAFGDDLPTEPLPGAWVEALTESGTLLTPTTESSTVSSFYGVQGRVELRTSFPLFYATNVTTVDVTAHQSVRIGLKRLDKPGLTVAGAYTLTITASPSCSSLPEQARTRTFRADVAAHVAASFAVTLHDAVFETYKGILGNSIEGRILDVDRAEFTFAGRDGVEWGYTTLVLETLADPEGTYEPRGLATATIDDAGIAGSLGGSISFSQKQPPQFFSCSATDHGFTMVRR